VVAEKEYLIHQLLPHFEFNEYGCYEVRFCLDGAWSSTLIDSFLPSIPSEQMVSRAHNKRKDDHGIVTSDSGIVFKPAFASGTVFWPAFIEKAYAKIHGSYARLSGGFISEALYDLTGAPIERIYFHREYDADELLARLLSFTSSGFLMGIATNRGGDGLVPCHAYSLLGVYEVHDVIEGVQGKVTQYFNNQTSFDQNSMDNKKERKTVRLVCIRNPWGTKEWKGSWGINSENWTRKIRQQIGEEFLKQGNGTFFMSFEDMIERFDHLDVAKCQEVRNHLR